MNTPINSSNSFTVKVTDEFKSVMFIAQVPYNVESAFRDIVKPFITNVVKCEPGMGNDGKDLEYVCTYDGICVDYMAFTEVMSKGY